MSFAFVPTKADVGKKPYRVRVTAVPDGAFCVLKRVELWATNGVAAYSSTATHAAGRRVLVARPP